MSEHPSMYGQQRILTLSGTTLAEVWPIPTSRLVGYRFTDVGTGTTSCGEGDPFEILGDLSMSGKDVENAMVALGKWQ
jgi:hypothetical protein